MKAETFLIVDDDNNFRLRLVKAFNDRGYHAIGASNSAEAIDEAKKHKPSKAVIDLKLSNENGLDLIEKFSKELPKTKIIMLTGYGSIATAVEAVKCGAVSYLTKPANAEEILQAFSSYSDVKKKIETPSLAKAEWEHLQRVLTDCDGNISRAANKLNIPRRTLQRKLQKFPPRE